MIRSGLFVLTALGYLLAPALAQSDDGTKLDVK